VRASARVRECAGARVRGCARSVPLRARFVIEGQECGRTHEVTAGRQCRQIRRFRAAYRAYLRVSLFGRLETGCSLTIRVSCTRVSFSISTVMRARIFPKRVVSKISASSEFDHPWRGRGERAYARGTRVRLRYRYRSGSSHRRRLSRTESTHEAGGEGASWRVDFSFSSLFLLLSRSEKPQRESERERESSISRAI